MKENENGTLKIFLLSSKKNLKENLNSSPGHNRPRAISGYGVKSSVPPLPSRNIEKLI